VATRPVSDPLDTIAALLEKRPDRRWPAR